MTIMITLGLHTGCIGGIFITVIFGNFYTKLGEFLTFKTGIPGGLAACAQLSTADLLRILSYYVTLVTLRWLTLLIFSSGDSYYSSC